jgi:DNA-binding MarR family transcriptional regulator
VTQAGLLEKHDGALDGAMGVRLWLRLLSATMIVEKRVRRRFAEQFETTLPRFDILAALDRQPGGMTMSELSRTLLVSNGNVTALVQTLASDGLLSVAQSATDRRVSTVALTAAGATRFAEMATTHRAWIEAMFAGLTAYEKTALFDLLGTLKTSIADEEQP